MKKSAYLLRLIWKFDRIYCCMLPLVALGRAFRGILFMIFPKLIIDAMLRDTGRQSAFVLALVMGGCLLLGSVFADLLEKYQEQKIVACREWMVLLLQEKLVKTEYEKLEEPGFMDSYQKALSVYTLWQADLKRGVDALLQAASGILSIAVSAAVLLTLNGWIALLVSAAVILSSLCNAWAVKRMSALLQSFAPQVRRVSYFMNELQERKYAKEIRVYRMQEWLAGRADRLLQSILAGTMKAVNRQISAEAVSIIAGALQECCAYLYIGWLALKKRITLGDVTMYVSAINTFAESMKETMRQYLVWKELVPYYEDFWNFITDQTGMNGYRIFSCGDRVGVDGKEAQKAPGNLEIPEQISFELDHVSFRYPGSDTWILKDVCMRIPAGESLSLVGDNGAGKTTLVKLLMGLYEPVSGRILLDGRDLREYDREAYWRKVGVVFQDFKTLAFSIRDNIVLGKEPADDARLWAALRESGLWETVQGLPEKENAYLGKAFYENGIELSGGEQQKIAIAQMRYKNAPVMILDEPTANLSPMEEYRIFRQFYEMAAGKTVVFISHRMSSCRLCDRIVVLQGGSVAEQGTHEELMEKEGLYAGMFRTQAQYYV